MKTDLFIKLSNSKYAGQTTCDILNHAYGFEKFMKFNPLNYSTKKMNEIKSICACASTIKTVILKEKILLLKDVNPNMFRSPPFLYGIGNPAILKKKSVAVIGARQCSVYGKKVAYELGRELALRGLVVISGLAYGVDVNAHLGALEAGGLTVAVLGSGIKNCYPKGHQKVFEDIKSKGLVLSEYGLYAQPLKHHFPFRNRLISGLSDCLIVVEAKEKSGTMITVQYALDQGKSIYAIPGSVLSPLSKGTHQLIEQGAKIVVDIPSLIEEIINFE